MTNFVLDIEEENQTYTFLIHACQHKKRPFYIITSNLELTGLPRRIFVIIHNCFIGHPVPIKAYFVFRSQVMVWSGRTPKYRVLQ